jgi:alanyl-tRNA synthetase
VTGWGFATYVEKLRRITHEKAVEYEQLVERIHNLERQLDKLRLEQLLAEQLPHLLGTARLVGTVRVVTGLIPVHTADHLRSVAETLRQRLGQSGISLLAAHGDGKTQLVCAVTDDLASQYPAGKLVAAVAARLGGKGGGRPTLATAGVPNTEQIDTVLAEFPRMIEQWIPKD